MRVPQQWSVVLTHFGRKSGKRFQLRVWYVEIDGHVWVGTQDATRNWARNLRATGRAEIDFGTLPITCTATEGTDPTALKRFRAAIRSKHPVMSRLIDAMSRGKRPCCFRLEPTAG
jgi:deazaflavin-dependent oxidoreductase (nitroreductase family)